MASHEQVHSYNPFYKHEEISPRSIFAYKFLTIASLLLVHITNIHFAWKAPEDADHKPYYQTIWGQNEAHPTPFALNPTIVDLYWVAILIGQVGYVFHLFTGAHTVAAANVGSHFILNNVLIFAFTLSWVYGQLGLALVFLIFNYFNLNSLYFRHSTTTLSVHFPVVSGPLAWNYMALFWCGAAVANATSLPARIIANIAIWSFLGYGLFFLLAYKDWTMGMNISVLMASLGVHQFMYKFVALQWIFAFAIMATLFVLSAPIAVSFLMGKQVPVARGVIVNEDRERQPLLDGQTSGTTNGQSEQPSMFG